MKCPRCVQGIQNGTGQCPHCGFSLAYLDAQFGEDAVVLERLTDAASCVDPAQREKLEAALDRFEARFPQLFFAIYAGELPEMTDIRQFAFWLLNRATVPSLDHTRPNQNGALLVLDLGTLSVSFTLGYFIEPYFSDHELMTLLRQGHPQLEAGDYGAAFMNILDSFSSELSVKARTAARRPSPEIQQVDTPAGIPCRTREESPSYYREALRRRAASQPS